MGKGYVLHRLKRETPYLKRIMLASVLGGLLIGSGLGWAMSARQSPPPVAPPSRPQTSNKTSVLIGPKLNSQPDKTAAKPAAKPTPPPIKMVPARILSLTNWRLALPVNTAHAGNPDQIDQPELAGFSLSPYFRLNDNKNGVIFRAHAGGATTENSSYPRSELREMTSRGTRAASWSNTSGTHVMTIRQAITHLPVAKPEVVAGQIHDAEDDIVMIRLSGQRLFAQADGDDWGTLDASYKLGATFTVKVEAAKGRIKIYYNGELKVDKARSGSGWYFKAGCYTQSNTSKGDAASAYGEVVIYSLQVAHG
jgi:hypothetical protein